MIERIVSVCVLLMLALISPAAAQDRLAPRYGRLELDRKSDYSHIRVRTKDNIRTLFFVRDNGEEVIESRVDLKQPQRLLLDYTKHMFLSYAFRPDQEKVLIVGLGGGAMVHFLARHDPEVKVDVLEIDPVVVEIADKQFGVRTAGNINVITVDGIKYLTETEERYDVIYMDAFLKPSEMTDANGVPLALKNPEFYKLVQEKLTPGGMVVFNLNPHAGTRKDVAEITKAFGQTYVFRLPDSHGLVAVATTAKERVAPATLVKAGKQLDGRFKASFSFEMMARGLIRP